MAEGDIGAIIASLEIDVENCTEPEIVHVSGDVFAVVYAGTDSDGWLKTITISDAGALALVSGGSLEFDVDYGRYPKIIHVSGNVYAIVYQGPATHGLIKTVTISDAGALALVSGGSLEFDDTQGLDPSIIHIADSVYAIAYVGPGDDGWLKTVTISDAGALALVSGGSLEFDNVDGWRPSIVHVGGVVYAIAYAKYAGKGYVKTVTISDAGDLAFVIGGSLEFEDTTAMIPKIIHVSGDVYAIAYQGPEDDGWLKTITISDAGALALVSGGSLEFDGVSGKEPDILHVSGDVYIVVWTDNAWAGYGKTVHITDAGAISYADGTGAQWSPSSAQDPEILHVSGDVYVGVYQGDYGDGWVTTFGIETAIDGAIQHILLTGIG